MDPLESIDVDADSTFLLGLEAQARGYQLYHYLPENLTLNERTSKIETFMSDSTREKQTACWPDRRSPLFL